MTSEFRNLICTKSVTQFADYGGWVLIPVSYEYRGDAIVKSLYGAVGNDGFFGFDEILHTSRTINVAASADWTKRYDSVLVPVTTAIAPTSGQTPYDVYAKLIDGPGNNIISNTVRDLVGIGTNPQLPDPAFRNLKVLSATSPVKIGSFCIVQCSFEYQGPQILKTVYASIGNAGTFGFDEILHNQYENQLPAAASWTPVTWTAIVNITQAIAANKTYSVYFKLINGPGANVISPTASNIVTIEDTTPPLPNPEYRNLVITGYDGVVDLNAYDLVRVSFQYRGPAGQKTVYAAIGNDGVFGFDEIKNGSKVIAVPKAQDWINVNADVSIALSNGIDPKQSPYDLYAKLTGGEGGTIFSTKLQNVITVHDPNPQLPGSSFRSLVVKTYQTSVNQGDNLVLGVEYEYQGPRISKTLYGAVGNDGSFGFDEVLHAAAAIEVPEAYEYTRYTANVTVPVTEAINPKDSPYDLYCKLTGAGPDIISPIVQNVVTVKSTGFPDPDFKNLRVSTITSPVGIGETCWMECAFDYRGPELTKTLYVSIGRDGIFGFDEILHNSGPLNLIGYQDWTPVVGRIALEITDTIDFTRSPYDVYCKLTGAGPDLISPTVKNVVTINQGTGQGPTTGSLGDIEPLGFLPGEPIKIYVSFLAYCDSIIQQLDGWSTKLTITLGDLSGGDIESHFGREGSRVRQLITLGEMPEEDLTGTVTLEGRAGGDFFVMDEKQITVKALKPPPSGNGGGGDGDQSSGTPGWVWPVAAGIVVFAVAASPSGKKKRAPKREA